MIKHSFTAFVAGALIAGGVKLIERAPALAVAPKTACDLMLEEIDRKISFHQKRFDRAGWWIDLEEVALGHLSRAHLTGNAEEYAAAERALQQAFSKAEPKSGPFLTRARLSFALHRFDRVETDLDDSPLAEEMRADLAFHLGRYREAEAAYEAALQRKRTISRLVRLANYRWKTDRVDEAEELLADAIAIAPRKGEPRAWLEVMRGRIDLSRGRSAEAKAHFEAAEAAFSGWYLVQMGLAEAKAKLGDHEGALSIYGALEEKRSNPEHLHGMAALEEARGELARAAELHRRAAEGFARQIELFPEAYSAHALGHMLGHGDPTAIEIAERNARARPNAESMVLLAQAYASAGRVADAADAIRAALATPISTAELHATAAHVLAAAGDPEAAEQKRIALSMDPTAYEALSAAVRRP